MVQKNPRFTRAETLLAHTKIGRNEPCWCGSGEKYKECHLESDQRKVRKLHYARTARGTWPNWRTKSRLGQSTPVAHDAISWKEKGPKQGKIYLAQTIIAVVVIIVILLTQRNPEILILAAIVGIIALFHGRAAYYLLTKGQNRKG